MSLEQQVTALVDAANNLTSSVNNKMQEIDNARAEFENSFEPNLKLVLDKAYFVDGQNGDDSNDGSSSSPLRSIEGLANKLISGAKYIVYISGDVYINTTCGFSNNTIFFQKWPSALSARIVQGLGGSTTVNSDKIMYESAGCFALRNSFLHFREVDAVTAVKGQNEIDSSYSMIYRDDWGRGDVFFFRGEITINDVDFCKIASGPDLKNFAFWSTNFIRNGGKYLINIDQGVALLKFSAVTLSDAVALKDIVNGVRRDSAGVATNILTNVEELRVVTV